MQKQCNLNEIIHKNMMSWLKLAVILSIARFHYPVPVLKWNARGNKQLLIQSMLIAARLQGLQLWWFTYDYPKIWFSQIKRKVKTKFVFVLVPQQWKFELYCFYALQQWPCSLRADCSSAQLEPNTFEFDLWKSCFQAFGLDVSECSQQEL